MSHRKLSFYSNPTQERRFFITIAQRDYKAMLERMLTGFLLEEDPLKSMLEWLVGELRRVEAESKVGM